MHLHAMFPYFRKTGSPSNNFSVVKTFQKCNALDFKFYLHKFINENFPHMCNVKFDSVFTVINNTKRKKEKTDPKLTLHHGEKFYWLTYCDTIMEWTSGFPEITET